MLCQLVNNEDVSQWWFYYDQGYHVCPYSAGPEPVEGCPE